MRIVELILVVAFLAVLVRLVWGPSQWDRVLAYNSASNRLIAVLSVIAIVSKREFYLDMVIVYAAVSFLGVLIVTRFMERGELHR